LLHYRGRFSRLKVKFSQVSLVHFENIGKRHKHTLGSTAMKQHLLMLHGRACTLWKEHTLAVTTMLYFPNLFFRVLRKNNRSHYLMDRQCTRQN
jgi:hypothetical protein